MAASGHILVDLDGTFAEYYGWKGADHIGPPIPAMLTRVMAWLDEGIDVRVFTARACIPEQIPPIEAWCRKHLGRVLPVTNQKDVATIAIYDDRAFRVEANTGRVIGEQD